jgi:hypothetical protein
VGIAFWWGSRSGGDRDLVRIAFWCGSRQSLVSGVHRRTDFSANGFVFAQKHGPPPCGRGSRSSFSASGDDPVGSSVVVAHVEADARRPKG